MNALIDSTQELLRFAIAERDAFYDCSTDPEGNLTDPGDQAELDRMDQMIDRAQAALTIAVAPDHAAADVKVDDVVGWPGSITRIQAIKILDRATDKDDPHWEFVVEDFYDEASDTMPSIFHVFAAIGVTEGEYQKATGAQNIDWPSATSSVTENEMKAQALEERASELDDLASVFAGRCMGSAGIVTRCRAGECRREAARLRRSAEQDPEWIDIPPLLRREED